MLLRITFAAVLTVALIACGDTSDGSGVGSGEPSFEGCAVEVRASLVFYENVCFTGWVECGGEPVNPDAAGGTGFCDVPGITCEEPSRSETATITYAAGSTSCLFCSRADGPEVRCTPIPDGCGVQEIEHLASGSPETGTRPMMGDCGESE